MLDVVGMETVLANLEAFNITTQRKVAKAVENAAKYAKGVADELTPVSELGSHGNPPGTLKAGNAVRKGVGGLEISARFETVWELYNPVFYAGFVILGTRYMAARDFFTPALAYGRAKLYEDLIATVL